MNKKFKYTSLVAAGAVTLGLVGGTLAWFTSSDEAVNKFSTMGVNQGDTNGSGIKIYEDFEANKAQNMTPGTEVNKDVQVKNIDNYSQFIKAKIQVRVTDTEKNITETFDIVADPTEDNSLQYRVNNDDYKEIKLTLINLTTDTSNVGKWYEMNHQENGKEFYYLGQVGVNSYTNTLLDSVKLTKDAGVNYKNVKFEVVITANGIQTTNGAAQEQWKLDGTSLDGYYDGIGQAFAPIVGTEITTPAQPINPAPESTEPTN